MRILMPTQQLKVLSDPRGYAADRVDQSLVILSGVNITRS